MDTHSFPHLHRISIQLRIGFLGSLSFVLTGKIYIMISLYFPEEKWVIHFWDRPKKGPFWPILGDAPEKNYNHIEKGQAYRLTFCLVVRPAGRLNLEVQVLRRPVTGNC